MRRFVRKRASALVMLWLVGFGLLGCAQQPCVAARDAASVNEDGLESLNHRELARRLLRVTGGDELAPQIVDQMLQSFAESQTLPDSFIERFKEEADPEELNERMVEVYVKHYQRETMIAAIRFYQSEQGRIMVKKLPRVTAEGMAVGAAWGRSIAQKVIEKTSR